MAVKKNRKGTEYIEINGAIVAKRCTICREMKELEHFSNHKQGLGGTVSRCKPCVVEFGKKYYGYGGNSEEARERKREADRRYYAENRERIRERKNVSSKRYYAENKEKISAAMKISYQENRERILARANAYYKRKQAEKRELQPGEDLR